MRKFLLSVLFLSACTFLPAQLVINEASNRNYQTIADEDGDYPDWVELYNGGSTAINLSHYTLTDDPGNPTKWSFPDMMILPGEFKVVFCSGKNRHLTQPFTMVLNTGTFSPASGWNTHTFTTPFYWDGVSNLVVNTCSFNSIGYTVNSVFNQSTTPFRSTVAAWQDGSPASCSFVNGTYYTQRPNVQFNGVTLGTGIIQNSPYDYPAPYGNWYWGAHNQMLFTASELTAAGLTAGNITSLAFDVVTPDPCAYDYIEISMNTTSVSEMSGTFLPLNGYQNHTNFKLSTAGENVYLYSPSGTFVSSLFAGGCAVDNSVGCTTDGSTSHCIFATPTPGSSNNSSTPYTTYALEPTFSVNGGFFNSPLSVSINNPNTGVTEVRYTLDGSEPNAFSTLYDGTPIFLYLSTPIKARAFVSGSIPSTVHTESYFFNEYHTTPILSLVTENSNLYGPTGIFDNYNNDWLRAAHVEYFDSTSAHHLVFKSPVGLIMDGGAGGSRSQPQHSFRIEMDNSVLGTDPVNYPFIPGKPERSKYGKFYLRNGSNQYLTLPYKDAAQEMMMSRTTHNYYSGYRPVSVYINGEYFGLYELREKFDTDFFKTYDNATESSIEILSQSYFYGSVLRAVEGSTDHFWSDYAAFDALNPASLSYWYDADQYFDMEYYADYIIAESWMGNIDWPNNNIKIYRSDKTNNRWRFCTIDMELCMNPYGWTDCNFDHINYMFNQDPGTPYINIWLQSIQNTAFKNYFINRFADVMNTEYDTTRLLGIENDHFNYTVIEMQNEYERWGWGDLAGEMSFFNDNHQAFRDELACRTTQVRNHIQSNFSLPRQVDLTLDVYPAGAGKIHISTITPEDYPWEGIYFDGVPVRIEAIADSGFVFSHWESNGLISDTLSSVFNNLLSADATTFKAYFTINTSGIREVSNITADIKIYPSPAQNTLNVVNHTGGIAGNCQYQVCDMDGRLLQQGTITAAGKSTIDISGLQPSMYIIRISHENQVLKNFRFIKM